MGRPTRLALAGLSRAYTRGCLGNGADVPVIFKMATDASALGRSLGLTTQAAVRPGQAAADPTTQTLGLHQGHMPFAPQLVERHLLAAVVQCQTRIRNWALAPCVSR